MAASFFGPGSVGMPLYQAAQIRDKAQRAAEEGVSAAQELDGVAPPGWEQSITRMKKHKDISNPWALAWWLKRTGAHPAKHDEAADAEFDASVTRALLVTHGTDLPREYRAAAQGEVWAQSLLLDPNLPPMLVERRA
jgi:hypothetical protein